ncbi:MAG: hypothetical protein AAFN30_11095 [Actinomycetota bacterium]
MRRGLASLIMILSLLIGSVSWAGFVLTRTVLDPGRSEALADNLLDNTVVRGVIVDRLSDAVEAQIPASVPIPRQTIEQAADEALDDPRVEAVVRDGFVRAHQNALNGVEEPVMLNASALGQVGREKAVALRPELDAVLPAAPRLDVELPTGGLAVLGQLRDMVRRYTLIGALVALAGVALSFVLTDRRPRALRRLSYWAFANSAFWLIMGFGVPALVGRAAPSSVSIASAVVDVFFGAMIRPALMMFGAGVVLLLVSLAWPALARRRPAGMVDRPAAPGALHQRQPVLEGLSGGAYQPAPVPAPVAPLHPPYPAAAGDPTNQGYDRYTVPATPASPYGAPAHPTTDPYAAPAHPTADAYGAPAHPTTDAYGAPAYPTTDAYGAPAQPGPEPYDGSTAVAPDGHPWPTAVAPSGYEETAAAPQPAPRADDPETWSMEDHEAPTRVWSRDDDFGPSSGHPGTR